MATVYATEEIKKDVESLIKIAREERVGGQSLARIFRLITPGLPFKPLEDYLNQEIAASKVTGRNLMTERFAQHVLAMISGYRSNQDMKLLKYCIELLYGPKSHRY